MVSRHLARTLRIGLAAAGLTLAAFASGAAQAAPLTPAPALADRGADAALVPVEYGWGRHHGHGYGHRHGWGRHHGWGHRHHGWHRRHHHRYGHHHHGHRGYGYY